MPEKLLANFGFDASPARERLARGGGLPVGVLAASRLTGLRASLAANTDCRRGDFMASLRAD